MPIDSSPEGGEIMHQPVVKPFPVTRQDQLRDERDHPSRADRAGEASAQEDQARKDAGQGLQDENDGLVNARPPLGN